MSKCSVIAGLLCAGASLFSAAALANGSAVGNGDDHGDGRAVELTAAPLSSCEFQGLYSSGCVEFIGSEWTAASAQTYCQEQERPGESAQVVEGACKKAEYNTLCSVPKTGSSLANVYVSDLPDFICKKYLKGTYTARAAGGW